MMFKETENGQTQYCPLCEEWAEKYDKLKKENEELRKDIETGTMCITCNKENENCRFLAENEKLKAEKFKIEDDFAYEIQARLYHMSEHAKYIKISEEYKNALKNIKEIIDFRFKTCYMRLGLKETDKIIEDITNIVNEVLNNE